MSGTPRRDLLTFLGKLEAASSQLMYVHAMLREASELADDNEAAIGGLATSWKDEVQKVQREIADVVQYCVDELPSLDSVSEKVRATLERLARNRS